MNTCLSLHNSEELIDYDRASISLISISKLFFFYTADRSVFAEFICLVDGGYLASCFIV